METRQTTMAEEQMAGHMKSSGCVRRKKKLWGSKGISVLGQIKNKSYLSLGILRFISWIRDQAGLSIFEVMDIILVWFS